MQLLISVFRHIKQGAFMKKSILYVALAAAFTPVVGLMGVAVRHRKS